MEENSIIYMIDEHSKIVENKNEYFTLSVLNNLQGIKNEDIHQKAIDYYFKSNNYLMKINDLFKQKYYFDKDENVLRKIKEEEEKIIKLNNEINELNKKIDDYY